MLPGCKKLLFFLCSSTITLMLLGFVSSKTVSKEENWKWVQRFLLQAYDYSASTDLKKWELSVTPEGFFRLKRYFASGKQEYFSFNLKRLKGVNYTGTAAYGNIIFNTDQDDIIVQTYNDPAGNIDSMSTDLSIPVLNIEPEKLDSLKVVLSMFKH